MNKKTRSSYTPVFKVECAQLVLNEGYSVKDTAQAMGVGISSLDKWVRKLRNERQGVVIQGQPITEEQRKFAKLEKYIKRLELEKDILKIPKGAH